MNNTKQQKETTCGAQKVTCKSRTTDKGAASNGGSHHQIVEPVSQAYRGMLRGDSRELLQQLPSCSVDAIVTDPPYELGIAGNGWDSTGVAFDVKLWKECLRVLKPGGHLLAFGGSRTYHSDQVAIAATDEASSRRSLTSGQRLNTH